MQKKIRIGTMRDRLAPVYIEVSLKDGRLSIVGDIPRDTAGQCQDTIREYREKHMIEYAEGWSYSELGVLLNVWDRWHLNDMKPTCEHQRAAGWEDQAREPVYTYQWTLKPDVREHKKALEAEALERARSVDPGRSVGFSQSERHTMRLEDYITTPEPELGERARWYEPTKDSTGSGYFAHVKENTRGWTRYAEDQRGLLGKPCEVCGYKYGSAWQTEPLSQDVTSYIEALLK